MCSLYYVSMKKIKMVYLKKKLGQILKLNLFEKIPFLFLIYIFSPNLKYSNCNILYGQNYKKVYLKKIAKILKLYLFEKFPFLFNFFVQISECRFLSLDIILYN